MVNKRYLKIVGLLIITLISVLGISCHKKEENEFILNAPTLEEKGVYLGESILRTEYYHATCKESFEIKENYAFKDYVSVCEELSINEITKENLTVLYNGYQLDSLIVNIIPKFLFSVISYDGEIYFGEKFGFYIKTTPVVTPKESKLESYNNFTANKYYESVVVLFDYSLNSEEDSENIYLENNFKVIGAFVFHTTTESDDIEYFPNSEIPYQPVTVLYEELTNNESLKLNFEVEFECSEEKKYTASYDELVSGVEEIVISKNDLPLNMLINYKVKVSVSDNYGKVVKKTVSKDEILKLV